MNAAIRTYVVDPLERAGSSAAEQFVVVLFASIPAVATGSGLLNLPWWGALIAAAGAAAASVLTSVATFTVPTLPPWADLALRVVKTFGQSLAGLLLADSTVDVLHVHWTAALNVAAGVAGLALLKGLVGLLLPSTDGASWLHNPTLTVPATVEASQRALGYLPPGRSTQEWSSRLPSAGALTTPPSTFDPLAPAVHS